MKIYFTILSFFLILSSTSFSQNDIKQNTISIGGNISFSSKSSDGVSDSRSSFILKPQFDYFIIDNMSLGLLVNIEIMGQGNFSESVIGFGPNVRYYFPLESIIPFAGLSYIYSNEKWSYSDNPNYDVTETQFVMTAGLEFFISTGLAFEPTISYKIMNEKLDESLIRLEPFYSNGKNELSSNIFEIGLGLKYFIN